MEGRYRASGWKEDLSDDRASRWREDIEPADGGKT